MKVDVWGLQVLSSYKCSGIVLADVSVDMSPGFAAAI